MTPRPGPTARRVGRRCADRPLPGRPELTENHINDMVFHMKTTLMIEEAIMRKLKAEALKIEDQV